MLSNCLLMDHLQDKNYPLYEEAKLYTISYIKSLEYRQLKSCWYLFVESWVQIIGSIAARDYLPTANFATLEVSLWYALVTECSLRTTLFYSALTEIALLHIESGRVHQYRNSQIAKMARAQHDISIALLITSVSGRPYLTRNSKYANTFRTMIALPRALS